MPARKRIKIRLGGKRPRLKLTGRKVKAKGGTSLPDVGAVSVKQLRQVYWFGVERELVLLAYVEYVANTGDMYRVLKKLPCKSTLSVEVHKELYTNYLEGWVAAVAETTEELRDELAEWGKDLKDVGLESDDLYPEVVKCTEQMAEVVKLIPLEVSPNVALESVLVPPNLLPISAWYRQKHRSTKKSARADEITNVARTCWHTLDAMDGLNPESLELRDVLKKAVEALEEIELPYAF